MNPKTNTVRLIVALLFVAAVVQLGLQPARAAGTLSITTLASALTENFDSLVNTGTSSTVPTGWDFVETGTNANTTYTAGTGSLTAGDTYSFGAAASTERAFGGLQSGSVIPTIGASFTNNTGVTITQLQIAYTGEMWRAGVTNRGVADRIDFQLSTDATGLTTGTWTDYDSLDFNSPNLAATAGALDGNAAGNRTAVSATINGLSIANGVTFWIRWASSDITSSDDGLAVDDFSLTAAAPTTPTDPSGVGAAVPDPVTQGSNVLLTVTVTPGTNPASTGLTVTADLTDIGGSATQAFYDDGSNGDSTGGDNVFSFTTVATGAGVKSLPVSISDAESRNGATTIAFTVEALVTPAALVINEIDYDQPSTDTAEFVEIRNNDSVAVNLDNYAIEMINGNGGGAAQYRLFDLPNVSLASGDYYVLCGNVATVANCDLDVTPDTDLIQNGAPDAVALLLGSTIVDTVSYEGDTGAPYTEGSGSGLEDPGTPGSDFLSISRSPAGLDTDQNNADFSTRCSTPGEVNVTATTDCAPDLAPTVTSTTPINTATDFPTDGDLSVTFSEPVNVATGWYDLSCTVSGAAIAVTVSGGPTTFTLDPNTDLADGESCTLTIVANKVTDQDTDDPPDAMAANVVVTFSPATPVDVCALTYTPIYDIQGSGPTTPVPGAVATRGIVVGDFEGAQPELQGFYIQDTTGDANAATSDGLFVFNPGNDSVAVGDVVYVAGTAVEFEGQTQISSVTNITNCGTGSIAPVDVTLPVPSSTYLEQYEGMLVRFPQTLYVTEHFQLGRFSQVLMSANARLQQPTNVVAPGAPAQALQAANDLNKIIVDDALNSQNPDPILFGRGGNPLSASNTLRGGDTAAGMVGVMTYTWGGNNASPNAYRLRPVGTLGGGVPNFQATNPRPAGAPAPTGDVRVAGMNLLNFFNTFTGCTYGVGGLPADCRGAESQTEFDRQWAKTVAAVTGTQADVIGIVEIENDGYGATSAIQELVDRLNDATASGTYTFINVDAATGQTNALGTDAIKVGLVYKPAAVTPVGTTAALNTASFVTGGDSDERNRPALAQAFADNDSGERFIVTVNHLKSKGSACNAADAGDGQGNCNAVRTAAANELAAWLASDPTGTGDPDILIMGDLNSYAKEDPIAALETAGYTNLVAALNGPNAYSYVFDGQWGYLDHALGSASILSQVTGVADWHINADEPSVLDYNTNFKSPGLIASLYAPDEFRIADHDPVLVDLALSAPPIGFCPAGAADTLRTGVVGVGMGNSSRGSKTRKLAMPNYQDVDSVYGQLAAVDTGIMKWVRFSVKDGPTVQVNNPTSPAIAPGTVRWWGAELEPGRYARGTFYWGKNGNRSPRAFVLWLTYNTQVEYANAFEKFGDSTTNFVHYPSSPVQTQTLEIPETQAAGADITVHVALVDINKDNRSVTLTVEVAGLPPQVRVVTVPNNKESLNLQTFVLQNVPAGTDVVTITLESPAVNGDSAAMIGAAANYVCSEPN